MSYRVLKFLFLFGIATGCGEIQKANNYLGKIYVNAITKVLPKKPLSLNIPDDALLSIRAADYELKALPNMDKNGFIFTDSCDSLLWTGLLSSAMPSVGPLSLTNISAASDGFRWYRRPDHECGPQWHNSESTISRDQILGLMWNLWKTKNLPVAISLMEALRANNYTLEGQGTPGELYVIPSYVQTLAMLIQAIGGPSYDAELHFPTAFSFTPGFTAHLAVWQILLNGQIQGFITLDEYSVLIQAYDSNHQNPLFSAAYHKYTDGDFTEATSLLLNTNLYPVDHLPNNDNYCSIWLPETTYGAADLQPCSENGPGDNKGFELPVIYYLVIKG